MVRLGTFLFFMCMLLAPSLYAQSYTFQQESLPCLRKKFTIVAHIFKDSNGNYGVAQNAINNAIKEVNTFFDPICVSFEVCDFLYHDNFQHDSVSIDQPGISNEIRKLYHSDYRINLYFVSFIPDFCGFASGQNTDAFTAGIFVMKSCTDARTIAHELGHLFSLAHTFEGNGTELVNGDNCSTEGDQICDTPADPYKALDPLPAYIDNCKFVFTGQDANGEYYNPDLGNIMSYYTCGTCGFTWGQLKRMADAYTNGSVKLW